MAYQYRYINELKQFNSTSYTLVLEDDAGIMPEIRNDKSFLNSKFPNLNDSDLNAEAQKDIEYYTQLYLDENPPE